MYIETKTRANNEKIVVFTFKDTEEDFNMYMSILKSYASHMPEPCIGPWNNLVKILQNRYQDNKTILIESEYADFIHLLSIILITCAAESEQQRYRISMPCPFCHQEGYVNFVHNEKTKENSYECTLCGFERVEIRNPKTNLAHDILKQDTKYAGVIVISKNINGTESYTRKKLPYGTSFQEAEQIVRQTKWEKDVKNVTAVWVDKNTREIKII